MLFKLYFKTHPSIRYILYYITYIKGQQALSRVFSNLLIRSFIILKLKNKLYSHLLHQKKFENHFMNHWSISNGVG